MFKTIGVLAHVDAGKTTFCEQLLFHTSSIRSRGRVDHQDAFLDHHAIERARGITIFAEQGRFHYKGVDYTLIDTPGHVDFAPEMERAIRVMDAAIIIVSAVDGIEGHTETVWQLLRQYEVPTFFFLNKTDREGADVQAVMQAIHRELTPHALLYEGEMEQMKEWLAERDEAFMAHYFDGTLTDDRATDGLRAAIMAQNGFLCMTGSALKDAGVLAFFDQLHQLTTTAYEADGPFCADVFKIRHDQQRLTFLKARRGTLRVRDEFRFGELTEKITEIRLYNGQQFETVQRVEAGEIFAVKGLITPQIGDAIGEGIVTAPDFQLVPTLQAKVMHDGTLHIKEVMRIFRELEAEEPSLRVRWHEQFQEISVHVMGVIQLEVLAEVLRERFSLHVTFGPPQILYKETIANTVTGYGHFEPLKHYAEVHLKLTPNARGTGITFTNACHADDLAVGHQRLIEQHVLERAHHGLLTGFPLTDVQVTLITGRAHNQHTAGGDFREATWRALRQGLEQAENVLLEPFYRFKMKAATEHIGRMMTDIERASGTFDPPVMTEDSVLLTGRAPVVTFMSYSTTFAAFTNGKGVLTLQFGGYDVCHNAQEVMAQVGYNKDTDPEYSSASIFCAKGKGYSVPWYEAKAAMHCLVEE